MNDETVPSCEICGNAAGNTTLAAREMMFGLREPFVYRACAGCGALRLLDPPDDWARFYPTNYYSFAPPRSRESSLRRHLRRTLVRHAMGDRTLMGALLSRRWSVPPFPEWMERTGTGYADRILDVGSGAGTLLVQMAAGGFTNLTGSDPFVAGDTAPAPGVRVLKRELADVEGPFKLVMMHHAFEHMANPEGAMREAARLLPSGGHLLIRIPVAGTYAARTYGADWIQLDAPRHHVLHTERSVALLADRTGFDVVGVVYDSSDFQFWGSEQYRQDIPLFDPRSHATNSAASPFSPEQIAAFKRQAEELNAAGDGDQAAFYLRRR